MKTIFYKNIYTNDFYKKNKNTFNIKNKFIIKNVNTKFEGFYDKF